MNFGISKISNYVGDIGNQDFWYEEMIYRSKIEEIKLKLGNPKF